MVPQNTFASFMAIWARRRTPWVAARNSTYPHRPSYTADLSFTQCGFEANFARCANFYLTSEILRSSSIGKLVAYSKQAIAAHQTGTSRKVFEIVKIFQ